MINEKVRADVIAAVNGLREDLIKLTSDIISIPSVTPTYPGETYDDIVGGETKVNEYLKPLLEDIGLQTDMWAVERGRANLVGVYKGTGGGKSLIFNGHVDVVPPGAEEEWTEASPWSGKVSDGKIWGRGASDMKGGNSAALIAMKAILKAGYKPKGDVILEYVVGEEMKNTEAGTGAVIQRGYKADAAIVVEPSSHPYRMSLIPVSPGVFYMAVNIKGRAVHACVRDELVRDGGGGSKVGVSSIDKAMVIYRGLKLLEEEWGQTKSHPMFTLPGHFTLNPGVISGGPKGAFIISEKSRIEYAIWHPPQESPERIKKEVEDQISLFAKTDPWLREHPPEVEWLLWWPPYDVPTDAPICKAVSQAYESAIGEPVKYHGLAFVDDATFLNEAGIPAISIGPGNFLVTHAPNEYVEIDELVDAAKIYALSIVEWCGV